MKRPKKTPLSEKDHRSFAEALCRAEEMLAPWVERFEEAYNVSGIDVRQMKSLMTLLVRKIPQTQQNRWYEMTFSDSQTKMSPYYTRVNQWSGK